MKKALVVNLRTAAYDVLIDRSTQWGNPYTHIKDRQTKAIYVVSTRAESIQRYEEWLRAQPDLMAELPKLKGKVLGCWCAPQACHGDVLARLANAVDRCCATSHEPLDTACRQFAEGANGRCVYCDHEMKCHPGPGATCDIGSGEQGNANEEG